MWLDVVKYICIIMVMLSHLEVNTDIWYAFYSPFFLSAFFFVSGYVYRPMGNFGTFLYKKIRQLFIPWLIFSVFNILLAQIFSFNQHQSLLTELKWNFLQIRGKGDELWFIVALFVAFIPFYFFIKYYEKFNAKFYKKNNIVCLITVLIAGILSLISMLYSKLMPPEILPWNNSALPWHIEYMFYAMFYMVLGYIFRQRIEKWLDKYNSFGRRIVVWLIYFAIIYIPYYSEMKLPVIIGILYNFFQSIIGITGIIMISKKIKSNKYVNYVGQNTLICFALHGKIYSIIETIFRRYIEDIYTFILANISIASLFALLFSIGISIILLIPIYIINNYLPFIMGKSNRN